MKNITILGSTGSIGVSTLRVVDQYADELRVAGLACGNNQRLLAEQVRQYRPGVAAVMNGEISEELRLACRESGTELLNGGRGVEAVAGHDGADVVVAGITGAAGLRPTIAAIERGVRVALANKEVMVMAGELVNDLCDRTGAEIVPVDSEHSAIYQCLRGERHSDLDTLLLCASGGPFRNFSKEQLAEVSVEEALQHPRWKMGQRITIDSATLMNKALEIVEARWLFQVLPKQIEVVVHPQCIVHSMVQFVDGTIMAQMGKTDMVMPIQYAISFPERWPNESTRISLADIGRLDFFTPDRAAFPSLDFAFAALEQGGTAPVILNAADEIAVALFLQGRLSFGGIFTVIERTLSGMKVEPHPSLEDVLTCDAEARKVAGRVAAALE